MSGKGGNQENGSGGAAQAVTVDEYIAQADAAVRPRLEAMRAAIRAAIPTAEERLSYRMPAYFLRGRPLVYFAAFPRHVGFYPTADGIAAFEARYAAEGLTWTKGAVQFPHAKPLPLALVAEVAAYRARAVEGGGR